MRPPSNPKDPDVPVTPAVEMDKVEAAVVRTGSVIQEDLQQAVIDYLAEKPYKEVYVMIPSLLNLPKV